MSTLPPCPHCGVTYREGEDWCVHKPWCPTVLPACRRCGEPLDPRDEGVTYEIDKGYAGSYIGMIPRRARGVHSSADLCLVALLKKLVSR